MTTVCQHGKVEKVYIKSKCGHSILFDTVNCLKLLNPKQALLKNKKFTLQKNVTECYSFNTCNLCDLFITLYVWCGLFKNILINLIKKVIFKCNFVAL